MVTSAKVLAPIIPFTTEEMNQQLVRSGGGAAPISIHLCDFPQASESLVDAPLLHGMDSILVLVEQAHAARNMAGIKVRQPLAELRVVLNEKGLAERMTPFLPLVLDELNVKAVNFTDSVSDLYAVSVRLDGKKGKPKYGKLFVALQEALLSLPGAVVESSVTAGKALTLRIGNQDIELLSDEVIVEKQPVDGWALSEGNGMLVVVDARLNEELIREGYVRDLVRHIQKLRKEIGLDVTDRIRVDYVSSDEIAAAVSAHAEYISSETLATDIERMDRTPSRYHSLRLGSEEVKIELNRA